MIPTTWLLWNEQLFLKTYLNYSVWTPLHNYYLVHTNDKDSSPVTLDDPQNIMCVVFMGIRSGFILRAWFKITMEKVPLSSKKCFFFQFLGKSWAQEQLCSDCPSNCFHCLRQHGCLLLTTQSSGAVCCGLDPHKLQMAVLTAADSRRTNLLCLSSCTSTLTLVMLSASVHWQWQVWRPVYVYKYEDGDSKRSKSRVWNDGRFSPSTVTILASKQKRRDHQRIFKLAGKNGGRGRSTDGDLHVTWNRGHAQESKTQLADILAGDNHGHILPSSFLVSTQQPCLIWDDTALSKFTRYTK